MFLRRFQRFSKPTLVEFLENPSGYLCLIADWITLLPSCHLLDMEFQVLVVAKCSILQYLPALDLLATRSEAMVTSTTEPVCPRRKVKVFPSLRTTRSSLASSLDSASPLRSDLLEPHSGDLLLKSPVTRTSPFVDLRLSSSWSSCLT